MAKSMPGLPTTSYRKSLCTNVSSHETSHLLCPPPRFLRTPSNHFSHWGRSYQYYCNFNSKFFYSHFKPCFLYPIPYSSHASLTDSISHNVNTPIPSPARQWLPRWYLHCCFWNCCNITNKLKQFQTFVYSRSLDVIALTETRQTDKTQDNEILPSVYLLYHSDRSSCGNEAMICISSKIPSHFIQSYFSIDVTSIELIF